MTITFLPGDLENALSQLLTNQLDGLGWNYFDVDLDTAARDVRAEADEQEVRAFFARIGASTAKTEALKLDSIEHERVQATESANEAMAYFFALLSQDGKALADFIRNQLASNHLINRTDANTGTLGKLNARERKKREKKYQERLAWHNTQEGTKYVVLAEGDSWFQFPKLYVYRPVKDLIHHFTEDRMYAVKTLAAGGDWLASIANSDEHLSALAETQPDVLLLSGGGNDLVGGERLADMVTIHAPGNLPARVKELLEIRRAENSPKLNLSRYTNGLRFLDVKVLDFLNQYFMVYFHLIYTIHHQPCDRKPLIVTQGYDYVLPSPENKGRLLKRLANEAVGNGKWLHHPLRKTGITDLQDQHDVMYAIIYEFNEMLITLTRYGGFGRLRHLDVRGFAGPDDWFDELHLKSEKNRVLARNYQALITRELSQWRTEEMEKVWEVEN